METTLTFAIIIIAVALVFDFANGWHDSANSIATVVSTRVLTFSLEWRRGITRTGITTDGATGMPIVRAIMTGGAIGIPTCSK